jgi:HEAT repeat protein
MASAPSGRPSKRRWYQASTLNLMLLVGAVGVLVWRLRDSPWVDPDLAWRLGRLDARDADERLGVLDEISALIGNDQAKADMVRSRVERTLQDPDPRVRARAVVLWRALPMAVELPARPAPERLAAARRRLIPMLADADPTVRAFAASGIGELGGVTDVERSRLDAATRDPDASVRLAAISALLNAGGQSWELNALVRLGLADREALVRRAVLGFAGSEMIKRQTGQFVQVGGRTVEPSLSTTLEPDTIAAVAAILSDPADEGQVARAAAGLIVELPLAPPQGAIGPLRRGLAAPTPEVRLAALRGLLLLGQRGADVDAAIEGLLVDRRSYSIPDDTARLILEFGGPPSLVPALEAAHRADLPQDGTSDEPISFQRAAILRIAPEGEAGRRALADLIAAIEAVPPRGSLDPGASANSAPGLVDPALIRARQAIELLRLVGPAASPALPALRKVFQGGDLRLHGLVQAAIASIEAQAPRQASPESLQVPPAAGR